MLALHSSHYAVSLTSFSPLTSPPSPSLRHVSLRRLHVLVLLLSPGSLTAECPFQPLSNASVHSNTSLQLLNHSDTRAERRGRVARHQRRLLLAEVEKRIVQYKSTLTKGWKRSCYATGEWQWLKQDILDLAKPNLQTPYNLTVTSRMERLYKCLLPSLKRQ